MRSLCGSWSRSGRKLWIGGVSVGALLVALGCGDGITGITEKALLAHANFVSIQPYTDNPFYWMYGGEPVLLIGGSDQDNLFNHPDIPPAGLEAHLDRLASAGGNYVRNTMSSRDDGNVWPFGPVGNGLYDLDTWNDEYWARFDNFLRMTFERDQIVQIEIWDRFDFAREPWNENPFNPANNVTYSPEESGLPTEILTHPGQRENPFFRSTPSQEDRPLVLQYQRALVDKILSITLSYPHVLYTVSNETNESEIWSAYWADFIRDRAAREGRTVEVTEMWAREFADKTFSDPERYTFADISQNNHQTGQAHWDTGQARRASVAHRPLPINNVKIYGGPDVGGGHEEGTRKFWRNIFGGMASARFHRGPGAGVGLDELARTHLRSMRMLTNRMHIFAMEPRNDLLGDRRDDEAYALAEPGRQYAVYFPDGGAVTLDPVGLSGPVTVQWLDVLGSEWLPESASSSDDVTSLEAPGRGPWVVLVTGDDGG